MPAPKKKPVAKRTISAKKPTARNKKSKGWPVQVKIAVVGILLVLLSPFYYGYVLKFFSSTWRWITDFGGDRHYHVYKNFGIAIPDKYKIHGIDVSYAQGHVDWQKVRAVNEDSVRISFAFIKATEGLLLVDPYFQRNWREAAKTGIVCGAYHYFKPSKSGSAQAKFFLQVAKTEKGDLPMVVDVEELNRVAPDQMRKQLKDYLSYIEKHTKVKPIIYSGMSFYTDYLKGYFDDYQLWVANYDQAETKISGGKQWAVWQHSDKANVTGINHVVDFDAFYGDSTAFKSLLVK